MEKELIYVASPYTPKEDLIPSAAEALMNLRYQMVCGAVAGFIKQGYKVFSPIAHSHEIGKILGNSVDTAFWTDLDLSLLRCCKELWVLLLPGWDESSGIKIEVAEAERLGIKIRYVTWPELEVFDGPGACHRGF